ncbi:MAG TPA: hypothetical protein VK636_19050 [Gemmatimonadaceae bacterium]|nr:hypothetical protein [Gemmatimonadaceae bacterium]
MQRYGAGDQDSGVVAYEMGSDFIRLRFRDGSEYLYDCTTPGSEHVEKMKALAAAGRGLTTYINQHVRKSFASARRADEGGLHP